MIYKNGQYENSITIIFRKLNFGCWTFYFIIFYSLTIFYFFLHVLPFQPLFRKKYSPIKKKKKERTSCKSNKNFDFLFCFFLFFFNVTCLLRKFGMAFSLYTDTIHPWIFIQFYRIFLAMYTVKAYTHRYILHKKVKTARGKFKRKEKKKKKKTCFS